MMAYQTTSNQNLSILYIDVWQSIRDDVLHQQLNIQKCTAYSDVMSRGGAVVILPPSLYYIAIALMMMMMMMSILRCHAAI